MSACVCTDSPNISGWEVTDAVFPEQVTSRHLTFSAKRVSENHVLL